MSIRTVLIANRGEIAVRLIRACHDAGLRSVAVYAEPDRDALHTRLADEAYAIGGQTPATSYLDVARILAAARAAGADALHPGYGFLSENADAAQAVVDAGLTWIGPPPEVIRRLGDKISARRIAAAVGAPLSAGTRRPALDAGEVEAFAREHGLPVAIKAAHGGGGRGLKVARTMAEVAGLFESAVREAEAAFGRGECFVEQYLDRPRHVETQCLADQHGQVVVVSTRDCTLQRRHQKMVEEAPAPFLTAEQHDRLVGASKAILAEAGYRGAGTVEFLLSPAGVLSFLEVNTRLQVEHPVSEEVTGLDLVGEMFRIADGQPLGYDDPPARGHAFEFRITAEDPGRGFVPVPGPVTAFRPPSGPGIRVDAGVSAGSVVGPAWDSLLAKLIVTGTDRAHALRRSARALAEFEVEGLATALPFHRAIVTHPAFAGDALRVHTRSLETDLDLGLAPGPEPGQAPAPAGERLVLEVEGRRVEVLLPSGFGAAPPPAPVTLRPRRRQAARNRPAGVGTEALLAPMQGTVVSVAVDEGQRVEAGDLVVLVEAMKMEQPVHAHRAGRVSDLAARAGTGLAGGAVICRIVD